MPHVVDTMSPLLTTKEAASYTKLSRQTLATKRCHGNGPPFIKTGNFRSKVLYQQAALDQWLAARQHNSTASVPKPNRSPPPFRSTNK